MVYRSHLLGPQPEVFLALGLESLVLEEACHSLLLGQLGYQLASGLALVQSGLVHQLLEVEWEFPFLLGLDHQLVALLDRLPFITHPLSFEVILYCQISVLVVK